MGLSNDAAHEFAQQILLRTEQGKVPWGAVADGDGFSFVGTEAAIVIRSRDSDASAPFIFEVFGADNELRESLQSGWFYEEPSDELGQPLDWNGTLERLYHLARRRALRLDELTESLLGDIDQGRVGERPPPSLPTLSPTPAKADTELDDLPF